MPDTTTIADMFPSELAECRENLRHQWENRKIDKGLLQRAWEAAHHVATVLYQDYGASKVAIFGSLTQPRCFTEKSDIDIVVWGVSYNKCLDALWETEGLPTEFEIDLIDVKSIDRLFRQRIMNEAIPIDKDETVGHSFIQKTYPTLSAETEGTYGVNREKLIQRISNELIRIEKTIKRIERALEKIDVLPIDAKEFIERALAADLAEVYTGFEKIFERIASEVDKHIPSGSQWHKDLLTQMADHSLDRPPVVSEVTHRRLRKLLKYRHIEKNIYGDELIYSNSEKHAKQVSKLFDNVSKELDTFTAFLCET